MAGRHRDRRFASLREILGQFRRAQPPAVWVSVGTIGLADGPTGIAHRVTPEAFAEGRPVGGRYLALCGEQVLPVSLAVPARSHCPVCERGV